MTSYAKRAFQAAAILALMVAGVIGLLVFNSNDKTPIPATTPTLDRSPLGAHQIKPEVPSKSVQIRPIPFAEGQETPDSRATASRAIMLPGIVVDSIGRPFPHALVSVIAMDDGGPAPTPRFSMSSNADGKFELPLFPPHATEWLVCGRRDGLRPAALRVQHAGIAGGPPVRLILSEGESITGVVRLDGLPAAGARVWADVRVGKSPNLGGDLWWQGGSAETKIVQVHTDDEGRFSLQGLASTSYVVAADNFLGPEIRFLPGGTRRPRSFIRSCTREVTAPASGIALEVDSGALDIRIVSRGRVIPDAQVVLLDSRGDTRGTAMEDSLEFKLTAGEAYSLRASAVGYESTEAPIRPLARGERRTIEIELSAVETAELRLLLRGAAALTVRSIRVRVVPTTPLKGNEDAATAQLRGRLVATRTQEDLFVIPRVPYPPGRYIVVILPNERDSWLLPTEAEIELPARGLVEATLDVIAGGKIGATVLGPEGAPIPYAISVRDSDGAEVMTQRSLDGGPEFRELMLFGPAFAKRDAAAYRSQPGLLRPGVYEIVVTSPGFQSQRRHVTVSPGVTTAEQVRLVRTTDGSQGR